MNDIKRRILRVIVFYIVILLAGIPIVLISAGVFGLLATNPNERMLFSGFGYTLNLFSIAIDGVLTPLYTVKLSKEKDWSCKLLWSIFFISIAISLLYLPIVKLITFFRNG